MCVLYCIQLYCIEFYCIVLCYMCDFLMYFIKYSIAPYRIDLFPSYAPSFTLSSSIFLPLFSLHSSFPLYSFTLPSSLYLLSLPLSRTPLSLHPTLSLSFSLYSFTLPSSLYSFSPSGSIPLPLTLPLRIKRQETYFKTQQKMLKLR